MELSINEIKKRLPHRHPFLLIDRVVELEEGVSCTAIKNLTANEYVFEGHFPDNPVMPGVLILEAMAQTGGIAGYSLHPDPDNTLLLFAGVEKVRFKSPAVPGDQLRITTKFAYQKMNIWGFEGEAKVDGRLVAKATFKIAVMPKEGTTL